MVGLLRNILMHKFLLYNLMKSELKSRYKQAVLGIAWVIVQPLFLMFVFTIVFSHFIKVPSEGVPYPIFSYSALVPWMFFATALLRSTNSIVAHSNLVKKVYFPREIIVFSYVLAPLLDLFVSFFILILLMVYYKIAITLSIVMVLPVIMITIVFVSGLALMFAAFNVFARDIIHAMPLLVQLWMYLTPVAYPLSIVPARLKPIYMLNPMVAIISSCRSIILKGSIEDWSGLAVAAGMSAVTFVIGYIIFRKMEKSFADTV